MLGVLGAGGGGMGIAFPAAGDPGSRCFSRCKKQGRGLNFSVIIYLVCNPPPPLSLSCRGGGGIHILL